MRRLITCLLALVALAAFAGPVMACPMDCAMMIPHEPAAMGQMDSTAPGGNPCKNMPACPAMLACAVPAVLPAQPGVMNRVPVIAVVHFVRPVSPLIDRTLSPEPEPPSARG